MENRIDFYGKQNTVVLWGTGAPSLQIYYALGDEDRRRLLIAEDNRERLLAAKNEGVAVCPTSEIDLKDVRLFILPTYGINLVKRMRRRLLDRGLESKRILIISPAVFRNELAELGSLEALTLRAGQKALYINSLEFEVAHHCNLNCKGCNHFSPLSEKKFGDPEQFSRDLERIMSLVDHVGEIRLLGGEPLLNPDLYRFVEEARGIDKSDPITVMTNGILLLSPQDKLFDVMKRCSAGFGITLYPPVRESAGRIKDILDKEGVRYRIFNEVDMFNAQINPEGDSDPDQIESVCFSSECHIFENGFLTKCSVAHKLRVYSDHYGLSMDINNCSLDLNDDELNSSKLLDYLHGPNDMCRYCGKWRLFPWEMAKKEPAREDWYCQR